MSNIEKLEWILTEPEKISFETDASAIDVPISLVDVADPARFLNGAGNQVVPMGEQITIKKISFTLPNLFCKGDLNPQFSIKFQSFTPGGAPETNDLTQFGKNGISLLPEPGIYDYEMGLDIPSGDDRLENDWAIQVGLIFGTVSMANLPDDYAETTFFPQVGLLIAHNQDLN